MAHDAELDRLKAAQDSAFQRKQSAYDAMDTAWKRRSAAREVLDRAHTAKQNAYDAQNSAWEYYQSVRASNGPRIDSLNDQQERAFQNMKNAFDRASNAHDMRDGASARMHADQGHSYKAESQSCVAERRRLVQEIRNAKERHESTRPAFQYAKSQFDEAKSMHDRARDDHQHKQEEFKRAKADFDAAVAAFKKRLEIVRAESQRRRQDKRSIAERAGVPFQYLDNIWVSRQGSVYNIYFGGVGKPNGLGHGHYVMDENDNVTYRRDPFDPSGAQNFERVQGDTSLLYMRSARSGHAPMNTNEHGGVFYRRSDSGGTTLHITQYFDDGYHVSWDATPYGNQNVHWTNKNVPKGHPNRFTPPDDSAL